MITGSPNDQRQIIADSNELNTLVINGNYEASRVKILSPYASYNHNYLLLSFVSHFVKWNTDESILINIINRTVEQQDPEIFNEDIVADVVELLLEYHNTFNESMILLLKSVPPIRNVRILSSIYENIINAFNPFIIEALVNSGHVPLTIDHYEDIRSMYHQSHGYRFSNGGPNFPSVQERYNKFNEVFNRIRPSAHSETLYLLYSLNRFNRFYSKKNPKFLSAENVEDLYSHLNAIATNIYQ